MKAKAHPILESGETILWEGRPVVWRCVTAHIPIVVLGIPWCGVAYLLWTDAGVAHTAGFWATLGMVTCFGFMAVTAPLHAWFLVRGTTYVLTNQRAMVLAPSLIKRRSVESFRVSAWKLDVVRRRNGSGEILFAKFGMGGRLGFKHLADVSVVEPLLRGLEKTAAVPVLVRFARPDHHEIAS
jgi:hypothetical protein